MPPACESSVAVPYGLVGDCGSALSALPRLAAPAPTAVPPTAAAAADRLMMGLREANDASNEGVGEPRAYLSPAASSDRRLCSRRRRNQVRARTVMRRRAPKTLSSAIWRSAESSSVNGAKQELSCGVDVPRTSAGHCQNRHRPGGCRDHRWRPRSDSRSDPSLCARSGC